LWKIAKFVAEKTFISDKFKGKIEILSTHCLLHQKFGLSVGKMQLLALPTFFYPQHCFTDVYFLFFSLIHH